MILVTFQFYYVCIKTAYFQGSTPCNRVFNNHLIFSKDLVSFIINMVFEGLIDIFV